MNEPLRLGGETFNSRFMIGTGKFPSDEVMNRCLEASEAEIITVAVRRVDPRHPDTGILSALDPGEDLHPPQHLGSTERRGGGPHGQPRPRHGLPTG